MVPGPAVLLITSSFILFLVRWSSLTFFALPVFCSVTVQKPESDTILYLPSSSVKFMHSSRKNCCVKFGMVSSSRVWDGEYLWVLGAYPSARQCGLWVGVATSTCAGLTAVSFVWKDKPNGNKVGMLGVEADFLLESPLVLAPYKR